MLRLTILTLLFSCCAPWVVGQEKIKLILDTDIGADIDDAFALAYIGSHPQVDLLGVTISHGNTRRRAGIACKFLHRMGRAEVPVAVGRSTSDVIDYQSVWSEDFILKQPVEMSAVEFIRQQAEKYPQQIVFLGIGPPVNLADFLRAYPQVKRPFKRVVLMSGNLNHTAHLPFAIAEWNVKAALEEARRIYRAGLPLTIVPLDATTYVRMKPAERSLLRGRSDPTSMALECLYRLWQEDPHRTMTMHDPLAAVEAVAPGEFFLRYEDLPLVVDAAGKTVVDQTNGQKVRVRLQARRDEFMEHLMSHIAP